MPAPTVYKSFTREEMESRSITSVSAAQKTSMQNTISNFITYFKDKHLS